MKKYLLALTTLVVIGTSFANAQNPTFWGLTSGVAAGAYGTLFNINASGSTFKVDYTFSPSAGFNPLGNLIYSNEDGLLYGLTAQGGVDGFSTNGVIFNYNMATGAYNVVYDFADYDTISSAGQIPWGSLVQVNDGGGSYTFYGMTQQGGSYSHGMIFEYSPIYGEEDLYSFTAGSDGGAPTGSLIEASNGTLYGLTNYQAGTIFSFTGTVNTLHRFGSGTDGSGAPGSLIQAGNGLLYGMTQFGGTSDSGTIFSYNISTGTETVLHNFGSGTDGSEPQFGALVQASNSLLYGMTSHGGVNGKGTIFSYNITTGVETDIHDFGAGTDGTSPLGSLIQGSDGLLYGMTTGGYNGVAVVFSYNISTGVETVIYHLNTDDESWPESDLLEYDVVNVSPSTATICSGTGVTLTANGGSSYTWAPAAGLSATTGSSVIANPSVTTTYTVTAAVTTSQANTATVIVTVNPDPVITVSPGSSTICSGGNITLTASGGNTYTWSPSAGLSTTAGSSVVADPSVTTTYTVTGTNASGCPGTKSAVIIVGSGVAPTITASASPSSYCIGGSSVLSASGANTYTWSPSTNLSATTGSSVTANPTATATYTVIGTNTDGCSNSTTVVVGVNQPPTVGIFSNSTSICSGSIDTLTPYGGQWLNMASFPGGARDYCAGFTIGTCEFMGCGYNATMYFNDFYKWQSKTNTWTSIASYPGAGVNATISASVEGKGYVGLGANNGGGGQTDLWRYDSTANIWTQMASLPATGRFNASCFVIGHNIYVIGGSTGGPPYLSDAWVYNTHTNQWSALGNGNSPVATVQGMVAFTIGSNGYLCGGYSSPNYLTASWKLDTTTNTWSQVASFPAPVMGNTAAFLLGNKAYVCSVTTTGGKPLTNGYVYNPTANNWSVFTNMEKNGIERRIVIGFAIGNNGYICTGLDSLGNFLSDMRQYNTAGINYTWSPTVNPVAGSASVTVSPFTTTTYTLTGSSSSGCSAATSNVVVTISGPTVTASANPTSYCTGGSSNLTVSGANTYTWSPSTGLNATTGSSVTANPTVTTTYTVTGTNSGGCFATNTVTVTVNSNPTITASPSPSSYCSGGSSTLTASGGSTYTWSPSTALSATTGSSVTANPTTTTTYTVTGTNSNGCSATKTVTVTVNPIPTISASPNPGSYCSGGSSTLTASGGNTYTWSPSTNLSATTGSSVTANPTATTTYSVIGTNSSGCSFTATVIVTVNPIPKIGAQASPSSYCVGGSTTLTASGGTTYTWSPITALSATTGSSVKANPTVTTTYTVTGTNSGGCSAIHTVKVTVNALPKITPSASPSSVCNANPTALTASGAATYIWSPATALSATTGSSVICTPSATTTYTVTGTGTNGCVGTHTLKVTVNPSTKVNTQPTAVSAKVGSTVQFSIIARVISPTYQWQLNRGKGYVNLADNSVYSNVTTATLTITNINLSMTGYLYRCIVTGECGSATSKGAALTVTTSSPREGEQVPSATNQTTTDNKLVIYPNPTTGQFTIQFNNNQNGYTLEIYNIVGEKVYQSVLSNWLNSINLSSQPAGMYFVYLKSDEGVEVGKVLVTK